MSYIAYMSQREYFQVDVPIRHSRNPAMHGVHVLTGEATSGTEALCLAREGYDSARAAYEAGHQIPFRWPIGWGARGLRPGWEPDWAAAKASQWVPWPMEP
ncbi:hypothetical protein ACFZAV_27470 [Streptomyces sp. NPDC008343]|uniref:hypothetical protein n=1 Tax=Streptomyces sp. NPDC008343 TaxID=3364828 RepID=UPI0036E096F3